MRLVKTWEFRSIHCACRKAGQQFQSQYLETTLSSAQSIEDARSTAELSYSDRRLLIGTARLTGDCKFRHRDTSACVSPLLSGTFLTTCLIRIPLQLFSQRPSGLRAGPQGHVVPAATWHCGTLHLLSQSAWHASTRCKSTTDVYLCMCPVLTNYLTTLRSNDQITRLQMAVRGTNLAFLISSSLSL